MVTNSDEHNPNKTITDNWKLEYASLASPAIGKSGTTSNRRKYRDYNREARERREALEPEAGKARSRWSLAYARVVEERRQRRQRVYDMFASATQRMMSNLHTKKSRVVRDQYGVVTREFDRVANTSWTQVNRNKVKLTDVIQNIRDVHDKAARDQLVQTQVM